MNITRRKLKNPGSDQVKEPLTKEFIKSFIVGVLVFAFIFACCEWPPLARALGFGIFYLFMVVGGLFMVVFMGACVRELYLQAKDAIFPPSENTIVSELSGIK